MSKVRVACFTVSLDGFAAGPNQDLQNPLGVGGFGLHRWLVGTQSFKDQHGGAGEIGSKGADNQFAERGMHNLGAWILGRNMFGPVRGPWPNEEWQGWWGDEPPYHTPVFVLSHYPRASITMKGGTTFHFVTDGIHAALAQARRAAGDRDIRIGGGAATIRQFLPAGLIDELHLAYSPVLLGSGESLLSRIDLPALGFDLTEKVTTLDALHLVLQKKR
jgi:dihydrofolate reductase